MTTEKRSEESRRLKITNQFRTRTGLVYDFKCDGARLTVTITARQNSADPGEWHVEARSAGPAQGPGVDAWGATRREAVLGAAGQWRSRTFELPAFDWDAVIAALAEVRAL